MTRSRYLVAYDICEPRRLQEVHKVMLGYGDPLQYSVFVCDLGAVELLSMKSDLSDVIHHREDRVAIINLGPPDGRGSTCFEFIGRSGHLPTARSQVF